MIYLDHNATTPLDPAVLDAMLPYLREFHANPSSVHLAGQRARHAVDDAREAFAEALSCHPRDLVFTSGGTEANNLALRGVVRATPEKRRIVVSAIEHPSVGETARALKSDGVEVIEVPVTPGGVVDLVALENAVTEGTSLVSVMWANNETGVLQPIEDVCRIAKAKQALVHVDAVQVAGRLPIDLATLPVDYLTLSPHKFHGPKGVGVLFLRANAPFNAVMTGGHQERGRRGGTENVAGIVGAGAAITLAGARREADAQRVKTLRNKLETALLREIPDVVVAGAGSPRLFNTSTICIGSVEGEASLMALDLAGVCVSSGSACSSGSLEPSHVLTAMGLAPRFARGAVRFSLGRGTIDAEVDEVIGLFPAFVERLRTHELPRS